MSLRSKGRSARRSRCFELHLESYYRGEKGWFKTVLVQERSADGCAVIKVLLYLATYIIQSTCRSKFVFEAGVSSYKRPHVLPLSVASPCAMASTTRRRSLFNRPSSASVTASFWFHACHTVDWYEPRRRMAHKSTVALSRLLRISTPILLWRPWRIFVNK